MNVPDHLMFLESHEWVDNSNPEAIKVGISDYAQDALTDIIFLELPEVGRTVEKGELIGVIESTKEASDLVCPVDGEVVEINSDLEEAPEPINTDPYGAGWMYAIKPSDPSQLESLMNATAYREHTS